jgi:hypothetical protein
MQAISKERHRCGVVAQKVIFAQPTHHLTSHLFQKIARNWYVNKTQDLPPYRPWFPCPNATAAVAVRCRPPPTTKLRRKKKKEAQPQKLILRPKNTFLMHQKSILMPQNSFIMPQNLILDSKL